MILGVELGQDDEGGMHSTNVSKVVQYLYELQSELERDGSVNDTGEQGTGRDSALS